MIINTMFEHFHKHGYMMVSGLVSDKEISQALYEINSSLGKGASPDQINTFHAVSWCPELRNKKEILSLYNNKVKEITDKLLGSSCWLSATQSSQYNQDGCQIAIRFPSPVSDLNIKNIPYHIDGIPTIDNNGHIGKLEPFSLLVGIFLNDVIEDNSGNLIVYPGSHIKHAKYFKKHGTQSLISSSDKINMPNINLQKPIQIKARKGDVVFSHYLLAHTVASNISPNIRYALYFRITSNSHNGEESMKNTWLDYLPFQR